jgi:hypothetical protein
LSSIDNPGNDTDLLEPETVLCMLCICVDADCEIACEIDTADDGTIEFIEFIVEVSAGEYDCTVGSGRGGVAWASSEEAPIV